MSGEWMPKRNREDRTSGQQTDRPEVIEVTDSPPATPQHRAEMSDSTPPHDDPRDSLLEQQLEALDVDDDFRESIRAMSPDTQRDVINDIIRHQQHSEAQGGLGFLEQMFADRGGPEPSTFTFRAGGEAMNIGVGGEPFYFESDEHEWVDAEEEGEEGGEGEEGVEEEEEEDAAMFDAIHARNGIHFGEAPSNQMNIVDFLQMVTRGVWSQHGVPPEMQVPYLPLTQQQYRQLHQPPPPQQQQQQDRRTMLGERMMGLQNLIGMLQQASAMQSMGLDRDVDEMSYEELLELEERIGNVSKGVPPAMLESCMTRSEATSPDETCPICQEELQAQPPTGPRKVCVKLLNCPHIFHKSCVKQWLSNNKTCPVCKQEVLPRPAASSS